jgi:hypothetical protein
MKKLYAAGLLFAMGGAHAATQTVDCGRLLDVKSGTWRERVSIVVENGSVKSIWRGRPAISTCRRIPACPASSTCTCT